MEFIGNKSKPMPSRQTSAAGGVAAAVAPLRSVEQFRQHLLNQLSDAAKTRVQSQGSIDGGSASPLRVLWEKSDLPAGKLADEVARFWNLRRLKLQDLMNAASAVEHFSARFLRESSVFPFRAEQGRFRLAVSDPTDAAAIRAVEIVCGGAVEVAVASFDDISTVLERQLDERSASAVYVDEPKHRSRDDDIDSLRDLASGAPVVRAVNDLLERAMELRASDIHIEPFRTGLVVRMRVDGMLRAVPAPAKCAAAGRHLAYQDSCQPKHRRTPAAAGWRGPGAGRTIRDRYSYCYHADAARRERRDPSAAARSWLAGAEQGRFRQPR